MPDLGVAQSMDIGRPVPLFQAHLVTGGGGLPMPQYAVSGDGQRFLMNVVTDESTVPSITIVQNWTAGLKK